MRKAHNLFVPPPANGVKGGTYRKGGPGQIEMLKSETVRASYAGGNTNKDSMREIKKTPGQQVFRTSKTSLKTSIAPSKGNSLKHTLI